MEEDTRSAFFDGRMKRENQEDEFVLFIVLKQKELPWNLM